jgi:hypothetical protein
MKKKYNTSSLKRLDRLQQDEDYFRGCTTPTKDWLPSASWGLCQIMNAFNKLKIMSEVMILLPNTDRIQQVEDNVRGWWWVLKKVKIFTGFIN